VRHAQPDEPVPAPRNKLRAQAIRLASFATTACAFLLLTFNLQVTLGYSALETGFAYLPYSIGTFIGAATAGNLVSRLDRTDEALVDLSEAI
jgi:hypothetical protein